MTTSYSLSDVLPKDAAGAKLAAILDLATSQNDFALIAGIGTKVANGKNYAAQYSGTALAGCKIETPTVGNLAMGALTTNPSALAFGNAIPIRADDRGQMFVSALSATTCVASGSTETMFTASGLLYRLIVSGCGVIAGAQVAFLNGATSIAHLTFSQANETLNVVDFGIHGTCVGNLKYERRGTISPVYVQAQYRNYGLG